MPSCLMLLVTVITMVRNELCEGTLKSVGGGCHHVYCSKSGGWSLSASSLFCEIWVGWMVGCFEVVLLHVSTIIEFPYTYCLYVCYFSAYQSFLNHVLSPSLRLSFPSLGQGEHSTHAYLTRCITERYHRDPLLHGELTLPVGMPEAFWNHPFRKCTMSHI